MAYIRSAHIRAVIARQSAFKARRQFGSMRGDPGLFGSILKKGLGLIPGVGTALNIASIGGMALGAGKKLLQAKASNLPMVRPPTAVTPYMPGAGSVGLGKVTGGRLGGLALAAGAGAAGAAGVGALMRGHGGGKRYRRINPLNPKAARRAINRIKALRKLTHDIERQLPKQKCAPARKGRCK